MIHEILKKKNVAQLAHKSFGEFTVQSSHSSGYSKAVIGDESRLLK